MTSFLRDDVRCLLWRWWVTCYISGPAGVVWWLLRPATSDLLQCSDHFLMTFRAWLALGIFYISFKEKNISIYMSILKQDKLFTRIVKHDYSLSLSKVIVWYVRYMIINFVKICTPCWTGYLPQYVLTKLCLYDYVFSFSFILTFLKNWLDF